MEALQAESPDVEPLVGLDGVGGGLFLLAGGLPLVAELPGGAAEPDDGEGGGVFSVEGSYFAF